MQSERRRLSRNRRFGPLGWALGLVVGLSLAVSAGCHRTEVPAERPVVVGVPAKVTQKVDNAQASFIDAVGSLASDYDKAVCEEEGQIAEGGWSQNAMAEAQLEVNDAVSSARAQTNRGGGPTAEDEDGITIIEEGPAKKRDRGGWTCVNAQDEPSCVDAAASHVTNRVYRNYVSGIDLNPVTAGDVLEAFAADAQWASQYLVDASDRAQAFSQIEEECRNGQSPLARFFQAAAEFDHPQVRRDLLALRDDFDGANNNVCGALPGYYKNLMSEVQNDLSRRVRTGHCSASDWQVLWDR